jgi:hypothetical protein
VTVLNLGRGGQLLEGTGACIVDCTYLEQNLIAFSVTSNYISILPQGNQMAQTLLQIMYT